MTSLPTLMRGVAASGSAASLLSITALALLGRRDSGSALAPLNAPSHWLFGRRALRQDGASLRYTATGLLTHQLSALFWALFYEGLLHRARPGAPSAARQLGDAALVTAAAAVVDLLVVPERLTPGFEHRLSRGSLALVYAAFGIGLACGGMWVERRRGR
jgi:hypothetical protein